MEFMTRTLMGAAVALALLAGCSQLAPEMQAVTGKVMVPAKITSYEPRAGSECTPLDDISSVTVRTSVGTFALPAGAPVIAYPDGESRPGGQWCELTFGGSIPKHSPPYSLDVGAHGSLAVDEEDLVAGFGVVADPSGLSGGRI